MKTIPMEITKGDFIIEGTEAYVVKEAPDMLLVIIECESKYANIVGYSDALIVVNHPEEESIGVSNMPTRIFFPNAVDEGWEVYQAGVDKYTINILFTAEWKDVLLKKPYYHDRCPWNTLFPSDFEIICILSPQFKNKIIGTKSKIFLPSIDSLISGTEHFMPTTYEHIIEEMGWDWA